MAKLKTARGAGAQELWSRLDKVNVGMWRRLLSAEKHRRGVGQRRLVFVGMHNVADIWWCAARAVRKARDREPAFFGAYLRDRLAYSLELGRVGALPRRMEDWLPIGEDLTRSDIDKLLLRRAPRQRGQEKEVIAEAKGGVLYVDPTLSAAKREVCADWARRMGWDLAEADKDPQLWSEMLHEQRAERYATIRWSFPWRQYVIVGVPDGLTGRFGYEFRVARADRVARRFVKPVATAQGDLYGYFFDRPVKRVQIYVTSKEKTYTFEEPADRARALKTLETFGSVDAGEAPRRPAAWKCTPARCEYFEPCTVRPPQPAEA